MPSESEFQAHLDDHPDDHQARMIFADWLDEQGDPRAAGYRALGVNQNWPCRSFEWDQDCANWWGSTTRQMSHRWLSPDWFDLLEIRGKEHHFAPLFSLRDPKNDPATRRELDDAAALAFSRLPAERQAELLALTAVG